MNYQLVEDILGAIHEAGVNDIYVEIDKASEVIQEDIMTLELPGGEIQVHIVT